MKIILLSHTANVSGGAEQCLIEYTEVLIRSGHRCKVIVPSKGPMTKYLADKGIEFVVVGYGWATKPHRNVNNKRLLTSTGSSICGIFREVERYRPSLIITNTIVIPWGLYAGRALNIPNILLVHEILSEKDPSLRMLPSYEDYGKILNNNTDYVIYNSNFVKNEFNNILYSPKTPNDILFPLPPLDKDTIRLHAKENKLKGDIKIAIFGALSPRKNQLEALRALKILQDNGHANLQLDLFGDTDADPKYTKIIKRYIRENITPGSVRLRGYVNNIYDVMNTYNIVLSTATYEPFGRTIIEGQLFRRIVIANNTGGGLELVEDMVDGRIYESGSPEDLSSKIEWVIENPSKAINLGVKAGKRQADRYLKNNRYKPLIDTVNAISLKKSDKTMYVFDPVLSMFEYNHHLNEKYKNIYRITNNRFTIIIKRIYHFMLRKFKNIAIKLN